MKSPFLTLITTLFCFVSIAQIQDLSDLAGGQFVSFGMLFNNYDPDDTCDICNEKSDVYGYYSLYNNGEVKENLYEIEYILFDKNLNKFSNGSFNILKAPKKSNSYVNLYKKQDTIVIVNKLDILTFGYENNLIIYQKLGLKNNHLLEPYYYEKGSKKIVNVNDMANSFSKKKLKNINKEIKWTEEQKDSARARKTLFSYNEKKTKLLLNIKKVNEKKKSSKKYEESLELINGENQVWKTQLPKPEKGEYRSYEELFIDKASKNIGIAGYYNKDKHKKLQVYDLETGRLKFKSTGFNERNTDYSYKESYNLTGDNFSVVSRMIKKSYFLLGFNFYRYDLKTQKELVNREFLWEDASDYIKINKKGYAGKGYMLKPLNFFFFKNGNFGVLTEKSKPNILFKGTEVTSDFLFFIFNSNLKLEDVKVIKKDKTLSMDRSVDYLFSQDVEGGSLIYYKDYQKGEGAKRKKWFLGIISYINGKFEHQKIPMSSEDYSIMPYPAKEGYILLREFNETNGKYNKIRLEKINY